VNTGRVFISLKPKISARSADRSSAVGAQAAKIRASRCTCRRRRTSPSAVVSPDPGQYTLADSDPGELNHWAPMFLDRLKQLPGITDVATDQMNAGLLLDITVNRDVASSYGITPSTVDNILNDAFGQRIVSTMYTMLNQYHVVLEVSPSSSTGRKHSMNFTSAHRAVSRCRCAPWSPAW
jgi:HAE1 family hydrophobic/amphiphilic exporter-1